jgi:hypothetical protein
MAKSAPTIDSLPTQKSLIDLSTTPRNAFNSVFIGYDLSDLLEDILLVEFIDEGGSANTIIRNGIVVPVNADTNAWRVGKVILAGLSCRKVKVGDFIMFPNNMGVPIANLDVANHGKVGHGIFLNEQRIFGIVKPRQDTQNEDVSLTRKPKGRAAK